MARPSIPEAARRQLEDAVGRLRDLIPAGWRVEVAQRSRDGGVLRVSSGGGKGDLAVLVRKAFEPRDVPGLAGPAGPTVLATRWLSPRSRELLERRGFGYIDQTGNTAVEMSRPGLYIQTEGARRDPVSRPATAPTLRGPKAWALLRTLAEVAPPYGVGDLAAAVGVDAGYVSRILKVLEGELLVERAARGPVTAVEWDGVLRKLVSTYSLFGANEISTWVAVGGGRQFLDDLSAKRAGPWVVSGSFASASIAPVAAPELALLFTSDPEQIAKIGHLLPATTGANVLLAVPYDKIVFKGVTASGKVPFASAVQTAIDNLTGPGRMPEEGEALIAWMRRNISRWRASSLNT